jgi:hypothetical protein
LQVFFDLKGFFQLLFRMGFYTEVMKLIGNGPSGTTGPVSVAVKRGEAD